MHGTDFAERPFADGNISERMVLGFEGSAFSKKYSQRDFPIKMLTNLQKQMGLDRRQKQLEGILFDLIEGT